MDGIEKRVEEMIDKVTGAVTGTTDVTEGLEMSPSVPNLNIGSQEGRSLREKIMSAQHNVVSGSEIMSVCTNVSSTVSLLDVILIYMNIFN